MLELPREASKARVTLDDLQAANGALINCGATIAEVNAVRRAWALVKGGGLSSAAGRANQVSLIVSDMNAGDERNVASGPTFTRADDLTAREIIERYKLAERLPASVIEAIKANVKRTISESFIREGSFAHYTLLDNTFALEAAAHAALMRGFRVQIACDLVEPPIREACARLVARLFDLLEHDGGADGVCLISGGEFACPVAGEGKGGRNPEAALRCALEFDELAREREDLRCAALHAGTDGVDGNSPPAGAIADERTVRRALSLGLDPRDFLARSDSYSFFKTLGDAIEIGAGGDERARFASPARAKN